MSEEVKSGFGDKIFEHFAYGDKPGKIVRALEFMIYFVGLLGTLFAMYTAFQVWFVGLTKESIVSWISVAAFTPFWILYGLLNKKTSLVMTYVIWLVVALIVIVGIFMRGGA